jgi:hypothetical protein
MIVQGAESIDGMEVLDFASQPHMAKAAEELLRRAGPKYCREGATVTFDAKVEDAGGAN